MIDSLFELNETVVNVVNRIVAESTARTLSGNYIADYEMVSDLISEEDFRKYFDFIVTELQGREEVLDLQVEGYELDCIYGLAWCPQYQWCEGDEDVFGMDFEEWSKTWQAESVSQPLSMARMAELGERSIFYVLDNSDMPFEDLTESLGLSLEELDRVGIRSNFELDELENDVSLGYVTSWINEDGQLSVRKYSSFEEAHALFAKQAEKGNAALHCVINGYSDYPILAYKRDGESIQLPTMEINSFDNPYASLASSKCILTYFPNSSIGWEHHDDAVAKLGLDDPVLDTSRALDVGHFRIQYVPPGEKYGSSNHLVNETQVSLAVFYDTNYIGDKFGINGQFTGGQYAVKTLLDSSSSRKDGYFPLGLSLNTDVESWYLSASEMSKVVRYLKACEREYATKNKEKPSLGALISDAGKESKKLSKEESYDPDKDKEH